MVPTVRAAAVVNGVVDDGTVHIHVVVVDVRSVTVVVTFLRLPLLLLLLRLPLLSCCRCCSRCCGCRCCSHCYGCRHYYSRCCGCRLFALLRLLCSRCLRYCGCRHFVRVVAIRLRVARLLVVAGRNVEPTLPAAAAGRSWPRRGRTRRRRTSYRRRRSAAAHRPGAAATAAARSSIGKRDERALRGNRQRENQCEFFHLVTLSILPTRLMYVPFPLRRLITMPSGGSWVVECGSHCMESVIFAYSVPRLRSSACALRIARALPQ